MDRVEQYRKIVRQVIEEYATEVARKKMTHFANSIGICLWFIVTASVIAADDPIASKLDKARKSYDVSTKQAKQELLDSLKRKEADAVKKGDKKRLDVITAEREAFEQSEKMPTTVSITDYRKATLRAASALEAEYKRAIREYTRTMERDLAATTEKQLIELYRAHQNFWRHPNGFFERVDNDGVWIELVPDGSHKHFNEIGRTLDYVELQDVDGGSRVKLYVNRCDVSFRPFTKTKTFYQGQWAAK